MPLKILLFTVRKRGGHTTPWQGQMGKYQGWSGGRRTKGRTRPRAFTVVSISRNGRGKVSSLGLASLNNFVGLWAIGVDP